MLPKVLDVPGFELLMGRPLVDEAAARSLAVDPTALRGTRPVPARRPGARRQLARDGPHGRCSTRTSSTRPRSAAVRLLLDVGSLYKSWEAIDAELMELLCVVSASLAAAFATRGYAVGLASNASLSQELHAVDLRPAHGALPDVLEAIARLRPFTVRDYGSVLADELADERGERRLRAGHGEAATGGPRPARPAARRAADDRRVRRRAAGRRRPGTPTSWSRATSTGGRPMRSRSALERAGVALGAVLEGVWCGALAAVLTGSPWALLSVFAVG